jgi:uncharacterized membrane protein YcgQ (UPF0703/DUF1980 family)
MVIKITKRQYYYIVVGMIYYLLICFMIVLLNSAIQLIGFSDERLREEVIKHETTSHVKQAQQKKF